MVTMLLYNIEKSSLVIPQNISIFVRQKKVSHTGLQPHEGE